MAPLEDVRDEFVQLWGRLGPLWGIPPATARVHAFLLSQPEPVDAESIQVALEMSRGAVSMACRELADWGLVQGERRRGERKLHYHVQDDAAQLIRGIVSRRKRREWDPLLEDVTRWRSALSRERSREAEVLRERLQEIGELVELVDSIAESFLRGGTIPKLGLKGLVALARRKSRPTA